MITRFSPNVAAMLSHPALRAVVVPSRAEPFGRIPLEAYAAGAAPVIATTAGGLADHIIHGVTGYLAPPKDPTALGHVLGEALAMTELQRAMRAAARRYGQAHYNHTHAVKEFLCKLAPCTLRMGNR
jgi:glycosyltransferase involved in cell wall biosynthesis